MGMRQLGRIFWGFLFWLSFVLFLVCFSLEFGTNIWYLNSFPLLVLIFSCRLVCGKLMSWLMSVSSLCVYASWDLRRAALQKWPCAWHS